MTFSIDPEREPGDPQHALAGRARRRTVLGRSTE
ncbi:hypothetical protein J2Z77_001071 [Streptomyces avidinii]|uniref:Uncharacterized protein n=1 Tax=Streptomyces avidinii TaxID=1895 RepID=A0ABS4KZ24_STRAV|nr:hypothetical protein [Streptomyces avidinii]